MKRSEINGYIQEALDFFGLMNFHLPPFAHWSAEDWAAKGPECAEIVEHQLGWDLTDFGLGRFKEWGLLLFTIRNGAVENAARRATKNYCEKAMIVREEQKTPAHRHQDKVEDIINRGGGNLLIQVWNAAPDGTQADTPVTLSLDGVEKTFDAGAVLTFQPGESVTLPTTCLHEFWAEPGRGLVLAGEVSTVNDDEHDNFFVEPVGRFPTIEEDEPPLRLLVGDYAHYCQG